MTILVLERVTPSVRGDLSRWLLELVPGVFAGHVSALVREALWTRATKRAGEGSVLLLWNAPSEQGFDVRAYQVRGRQPVDYDGVWLLERLDPSDTDDLPADSEDADVPEVHHASSLKSDV